MIVELFVSLVKQQQNHYHSTTNDKIHSIMCFKSREWWKCFWRSIIEIYMSLVTEWERKTIRTTDDEEEEAIDGESYLCQGFAEHGNEWKIEKSNLRVPFFWEKYLQLPKWRPPLKYF